MTNDDLFGGIWGACGGLWRGREGQGQGRGGQPRGVDRGSCPRRPGRALYDEEAGLIPGTDGRGGGGLYLPCPPPARRPGKAGSLDRSHGYFAPDKRATPCDSEVSGKSIAASL